MISYLSANNFRDSMILTKEIIYCDTIYIPQHKGLNTNTIIYINEQKHIIINLNK